MEKNNTMKFIYIGCIWLISHTFLNAQQPRLQQVDNYLTETGQPVTSFSQITEKKYCLPIQRYKETEKLMLDIPCFKNKGIRAIIPFGFSMSNLSEIELLPSNSNIQVSKPQKLYDTKYFSEITYLFCDSTVYGIKLECNKNNKNNYGKILAELDSLLYKPDFTNKNTTVYSDEDFLFRINHQADYIEIYSLFHYPTTETRYPGVKQKVFYGPCSFELNERESILLAFLNQESKENNVQSAFKLCYKSDKKLDLRKIDFTFDNGESLSFPLEQVSIVDDGTNYIVNDTRTFIFPEQLKKIARAKSINVTIEGEQGKISYQMPMFQRFAANLTYEYFRWQVTNPLAKYKDF